jgi:iron complex outermembrane receptor protein
MRFEGQNWQFELSGSIGVERDRVILGGYANLEAFEAALSTTNMALNPFVSGSSVSDAIKAAISKTDYFQSYSKLRSLEAQAVRTLRASVPGNTTISVGAQYRQETLSTFAPQLSPDPNLAWQTTERGVSSIYAHLELPLLGNEEGVPFIDALALSLGGRWERYSTGDTMTSPALSVEWVPLSPITLRGTYRGGFRPPALTERSSSRNFSEIFPSADGMNILGVSGGNPTLRPERAEVWTAGFDFKPTDGALLSGTYYTVSSRGRVYQPTFTGDPTNFNGGIISKPSAAQVAAVCNESQFVGGTAATCTQTPVDFIMDGRLQSLEKLTTSGIDVIAKYVEDSWRFRLDGTHLLSYRGTGPNGVVLERLNTINNPVDFRVKATLARSIGPITLSPSVNYTGGYWDDLSQPSRRIASWTTVDFAIAYQAMNNLELLFGARNLMNRQPPFAENTQMVAGWDPGNGGELAGLIVSGQVRCTF